MGACRWRWAMEVAAVENFLVKMDHYGRRWVRADADVP